MEEMLEQDTLRAREEAVFDAALSWSRAQVSPD
jgi:hypothetical protein